MNDWKHAHCTLIARHFKQPDGINMWCVLHQEFVITIPVSAKI
jgi:hypothetical protein